MSLKIILTVVFYDVILLGVSDLLPHLLLKDVY